MKSKAYILLQIRELLKKNRGFCDEEVDIWAKENEKKTVYEGSLDRLYNEDFGLFEELASGENNRSGSISNLVVLRPGDVDKCLSSWMHNI